MSSKEILEKYIKFYTERGHVLIPNVSLIPEGDSTLLYVNSGMFPLVPYLSGQPHPAGKRLVNVQRSLRFFEDLENIGVTVRHTSAFHMIGNWSLGDYFKTDQLPWAFEFLIDVLGLDINKLYATVFAGDEFSPKDTESIEIIKEIYKKYGIDAQEGSRIFPLGREDNWWKRGDAVGELGGPCSELFYYIEEGDGFGGNPEDAKDSYIEVGNSVFMQFKKTETGWEPLAQKNVDFGGGLERLALAIQGKTDIYETDNFWPIIQKVQQLTGKSYTQDAETKKSMRVIADHMRASVFLAMDGVIPSNKDQGYILRRLLRRMVRKAKILEVESISAQLVPTVCEMFSWLYPDLIQKQNEIVELFKTEEDKFLKTLKKAQSEVSKYIKNFDGDIAKLSQSAFNFYQSLGYPTELFIEDLKDAQLDFEEKQLEQEIKEKFDTHQAQSRSGAEQKFKGGLAEHSEQITKYHTATHLLQAALREVLGTHVGQKGSNITNERLRFDFSTPEKLSDEEIMRVEQFINKIILDNLPVNMVTLSKSEAEKTGALHLFGEKYGDTVNVYYIGNDLESAVSKEFCGGPHVKNTSEIGPINIYKQESIGKGLQRIYAKSI